MSNWPFFHHKQIFFWLFLIFRNWSKEWLKKSLLNEWKQKLPKNYHIWHCEFWRWLCISYFSKNIISPCFSARRKKKSWFAHIKHLKKERKLWWYLVKKNLCSSRASTIPPKTILCLCLESIESMSVRVHS